MMAQTPVSMQQQQQMTQVAHFMQMQARVQAAAEALPGMAAADFLEAAAAQQPPYPVYQQMAPPRGHSAPLPAPAFEQTQYTMTTYSAGRPRGAAYGQKSENTSYVHEPTAQPTGQQASLPGPSRGVHTGIHPNAVRPNSNT